MSVARWGGGSAGLPGGRAGHLPAQAPAALGSRALTDRLVSSLSSSELVASRASVQGTFEFNEKQE